MSAIAVGGVYTLDDDGTGKRCLGLVMRIIACDYRKLPAAIFDLRIDPHREQKFWGDWAVAHTRYLEDPLDHFASSEAVPANIRLIDALSAEDDGRTLFDGKMLGRGSIFAIPTPFS